mgnify:CR=1 FL=1
MSKYTPEVKIAACKDYLAGELSHQEICQKYGITFNKNACKSMLNEWVPGFLAAGESAFMTPKGNNEYSAKEKIKIVKEYLDGDISLTNLTAKHGIPSKETLRKWVSDFNAHKELNDYAPKTGIHSKKSQRKVDKKERQKIVQYCIDHNRDYKTTASVFNVSYSQVYSWTRSYKG